MATATAALAASIFCRMATRSAALAVEDEDALPIVGAVFDDDVALAVTAVSKSFDAAASNRCASAVACWAFMTSVSAD